MQPYPDLCRHLGVGEVTSGCAGATARPWRSEREAGVQGLSVKCGTSWMVGAEDVDRFPVLGALGTGKALVAHGWLPAQLLA